MMNRPETIYRYLGCFSAAFKGIESDEKNIPALIELRAEVIKKHEHWLVNGAPKLRDESLGIHFEYLLGIKFIEWICDSQLRPYSPGWEYKEEATANGMLALLAVLRAFGLDEPEVGQIQEGLHANVDAYTNENLDNLNGIYILLTCCIEHLVFIKAEQKKRTESI